MIYSVYTGVVKAYIAPPVKGESKLPPGQGGNPPHFSKEGENMDISGVVQIITNVGFPIAIVCYLLYYQKDTTDKLTTIISENTKAIELLRQEFHEHFKREDERK